MLWSSRYGCTIVLSHPEVNKFVSQWPLTFNLCIFVTWPLTCAFHIHCTHNPEIIDMHRGVCNKIKYARNRMGHAQNHILKQYVHITFLQSTTGLNISICKIICDDIYSVKSLRKHSSKSQSLDMDRVHGGYMIFNLEQLHFLECQSILSRQKASFTKTNIARQVYSSGHG